MTAPDGSALAYGRSSDYRVPGFVAWGDPRSRGYSGSSLLTSAQRADAAAITVAGLPMKVCRASAV